MAVNLRTILHVDMDAFYASVEQRDNPELRGQPVVVGGANRGVVAAASYESRAFGIRSAMPMSEAHRRCAHLVRVAPRMAHYKTVSREIFSIFRAYTPIVEGLSLDEAFLDVTASRNLHGSGRAIGLSIKRDILAQTELTASVGVATNKLVAKIASDLDKPDGLVVIDPENTQAILDPLPVEVIPGIGRQTLARLHRIRIHKIGDLRQAGDAGLRPIFGRFSQRMRDKAAGIDDRPVTALRAEKSISSEETFGDDLSARADMDKALLALAETTAQRLRRAGLTAGTVFIKIREADFQTCTRQRRQQPPVNSTEQIFDAAQSLLSAWLERNTGARLRLLGVGTSNLVPDGQGDLFRDVCTDAAPVDTAIDRIRDRFGPNAVGRARNL